MAELSYREAVRDALSRAMRDDDEDFITLATEQIVNQAAKHRYMSGGQLSVPVTFRTQGGAGWSPGAQHAQQLEAWFVHIPGLKVVFASTPSDVRGLLWSSI